METELANIGADHSRNSSGEIKMLSFYNYKDDIENNSNTKINSSNVMLNPQIASFISDISGDDIIPWKDQTPVQEEPDIYGDPIIGTISKTRNLSKSKS